jgi:hypothetical protein
MVRLFHLATFKSLMFNKLVSLIPLIRREDLLLIGREAELLEIVQPSYSFEVSMPKNDDDSVRFGHLCGIKNVDPFFALIIQDIRLIGPYGLPVTRSGKIIIEPIFEEWLPYVLEATIKDLGFFSFLWEYILCFFPFLDSPNNIIDFGSHVICRGSIWPNGPIFGHWMAEHLPQIRAIESIESRLTKKSRIIINRHPPKWQLESLELMGIQNDRLFIHSQKGLRVKKLIISSIRNVHSTNMELDPIARNWAAKRIQEGIRFRKSDVSYKFEKVCIFRQNQKSRRIKNFEEISKLIENFGYYNYEHTNLSLLESALIFQKTSDLIACFGSGIINIMLMENPRKLIELYSTAQANRDVFFLLACEFGVEYFSIFAETIEDTSTKSNSDDWKSDKINLAYQKNEVWHLKIDHLNQVIS